MSLHLFFCLPFQTHLNPFHNQSVCLIILFCFLFYFKPLSFTGLSPGSYNCWIAIAPYFWKASLLSSFSYQFESHVLRDAFITTESKASSSSSITICCYLSQSVIFFFFHDRDLTYLIHSINSTPCVASACLDKDSRGPKHW